MDLNQRPADYESILVAEQEITGYNKSKEISKLALSCYFLFHPVLACYGSRMVAGSWWGNRKTEKGGLGLLPPYLYIPCGDFSKFSEQTHIGQNSNKLVQHRKMFIKATTDKVSREMRSTPTYGTHAKKFHTIFSMEAGGKGNRKPSLHILSIKMQSVIIATLTKKCSNRASDLSGLKQRQGQINDPASMG